MQASGGLKAHVKINLFKCGSLGGTNKRLDTFTALPGI